MRLYWLYMQLRLYIHGDANMRRYSHWAGMLLLLIVSTVARPAESPTTDVLVMLTVKPDVQRERVLKLMPEEVRATVRLYLQGAIRNWYARSDGHGVVFILASKDVSEARSIMEGLPLASHNLVDLEFTAMG